MNFEFESRTSRRGASRLTVQQKSLCSAVLKVQRKNSKPGPVSAEYEIDDRLLSNLYIL